MDWAAIAALAAGLAVVSWRAGPAPRLQPAERSGVEPVVPKRARRARLTGSLAAGASALVLAGGIGWWAVPAAVALAVVSYVVLGSLGTGDARRRSRLVAAGLPQACDLLAVCLESGLPLRRATEVLAQALEGPLADVLAELSAQVAMGTDEARAWAEAGAAEPALAALGREIARTVGSGVALSQTLRALGLEARREAAAAAEVQARRVGVRSVLPLMICFLPAFLLLGVVPIIGGVVGHLLP